MKTFCSFVQREINTRTETSDKPKKVKNTHNLTEIKILRNKMVEKVIKSIEKQKSSQYFNFLIPI